MITYSDIYEALRKERYSEKLQLLPKNFVSNVSSYINEKKNLASQEDFLSEEITKINKQIENAKEIFEELMLLRKKKLLGLVFIASETGINHVDFENMLDFEKETFNEIVTLVKNIDKNLSLNFITNNLDKEMKMVAFSEDIEELIAPDGSAVGPFAKDEIANLPVGIAEIFIADKKAEFIGED